MGSIIIVMPKIEDAQHIHDVLNRRGLREAMPFTAAAQALARAGELDGGVVICSHRVSDMHYTTLASCLPEGFEMLLLASPEAPLSSTGGLITLTYPIKAGELAGTVSMMLAQQERRRRKKKTPGPKRTQREQNYINNAKWVLMERNHMTEPEAFRYIQKCSMDSGTNMVETAQMILLLMFEE